MESESWGITPKEFRDSYAGSNPPKPKQSIEQQLADMKKEIMALKRGHVFIKLQSCNNAFIDGAGI